MTIGGWITFLLSMTLVSALFIWCVWKVLSYKNPNKMQGADLFSEDGEDCGETPPKIIPKK